MGFQQFVNLQPVPGVSGDFAGSNPRMSASAPVGGYVAAPNVTVNGVAVPAFVVGRFAWGVPNNGDPTLGPAQAANYYQPKAVLGFVHRENQAIITAFLGDDVLAVPAGYQVGMMSRGDFWCDFSASKFGMGPGATVGQKVYADPLTGQAYAAAAGAGVSIAITASLASTGVLTVTATAGTLAAGQVITGAGVPAGSYIQSQLTGTAGSTGTYQLNNGATVASESMTATGPIETPWYVTQATPAPAAFTGAVAANTGVLTVSAVASGALAVGQRVSGTGLDPHTAVITRQLTGTAGSTGTYQLSYFGAAVASESMTASAGMVGKISTWQAA
jgi:hypothetical protein